MMLVLGLQATPSFSQNDDFVKQFQESRKTMLDEYNKFRNTVLTDYDKYMQGVWKEYQQFKGDQISKVPKPKTPPTYEKPKAPEKPVNVKPKMPYNKNVPIKLPDGGAGLVKKPGIGDMPAVPTNPLAKVPIIAIPKQEPKQEPTTPKVEPTVPKEPEPKKPLIADERPTVGPVNTPKFPETKPEIPDIEYTGSGIDIPLMPIMPKVPVMPALPNIAHVNVPVSKPKVTFDFYGAEITLPKALLIPSANIGSTNDVASYWKSLKSSDLKEVNQSFATQARNMGLSDWASAMLVEKYIDQVMPNASKNEKVIAMQYVLANCGYNIRLGMNNSTVALLVPYAEHVYEKSFIVVDGKRYYIYPDITSDGSFRTCQLPKDAEVGKDVELRFAGKSIITDACKEFNLQGGGLTLRGEVKTGIMPLLDVYPMVDIPTVASAIVDQKMRDDVVEQIRSQVQGLGEQEAANKILHFIQYAFKYATDEEQFGREKYFYFEESLYYPKNDCEDRAIFYAYLIHEILKLDVHLIQFPGHECTAVAFSQPVANATSYEYKGKTYYICDPTYIGASIGRCMPAYKNESPQIEVWY